MSMTSEDTKRHPRVRVPTLFDLFFGSISNWIRKRSRLRKQGRLGKSRRAPLRKVLTLEALEPRILLSADVSYTAAMDVTLRIADDSGPVLQLVNNDVPSDDPDFVQWSHALSSGESLNVSIDGSTDDDFLTIDFGLADGFAIDPLDIGVTFNGGGGDDMLIGADTDNTWDITGTNAGTLNASITFTNVENLTGGSGIDVFNFDDQAGISGTLDGGGGSNALNYSDYQTAVSVDLALHAATGTASARNFDDLTGGAAADTLIGLSTDTVWHITDLDGGDIYDVITFASIENLTGGANRDDFIVEAGGSISGTLDGGGGADGLVIFNDADESRTVVNPRSGGPHTFTLHDKSVTYAGLEPIVGGTADEREILGSAVVDVWMLDKNGADLRLSSTAGDFYDDTLATPAFVGSLAFAIPTSLTIDLGEGHDRLTLGDISGPSSVFVHGDAGDDTLIARDGVAHTWTIDAQDAGTVDGYAFSDIEVLVGGDDADTFDLINNNSEISGGIDGGSGGFDTLNYSGTGAGVTIQLGVGNVNIDSVIGSAGTDSLIGVADDNVWTIDAANAGQVVTTRQSTTILDDLTVVDDTANTIQFQTNHGLSDGDMVTYRSDLAAPDGSGLIAGTSYEVIVADSKTIQLKDNTGDVAELGPSVWSGGVNSLDHLAVVISDVRFIGFENLSGNIGNDDFVFADGMSVSGAIDGGDGSNSLDYSAYTSALTVDLGSAGAGAVSNIQRISGGTHSGDTLLGPDEDAIWEITGTNAGSVNGILFFGFENLTGAAENQDGFILRMGGSVFGLQAERAARMGSQLRIRIMPVIWRSSSRMERAVVRWKRMRSIPV
jgi:hypothetical protein